MGILVGHDTFRNSSLWGNLESKIMSRLDSRQKSLWNILVFLLRFLALALPFHVLLWINFDAYFLQVFTARSVSVLLSVFNVQHTYFDVYLIVPLENVQWTIEIIKDCVGWKSFLAVCGLVFAVRGVGFQRRLIGVIFALPLIYVGNVVRIFSSIYLTRIFGFESFEVIHGILWQGGMIALILAIWIFWLDRIAGVKSVKVKKR